MLPNGHCWFPEYYHGRQRDHIDVFLFCHLVQCNRRIVAGKEMRLTGTPQDGACLHLVEITPGFFLVACHHPVGQIDIFARWRHLTRHFWLLHYVYEMYLRFMKMC